MKITDAAERSRGYLMLLLELGFIAVDKGLSGRKIDPVVIGVGAALEKLLRRQRRRRIRVRRSQASRGSQTGQPSPNPPDRGFLNYAL